MAEENICYLTILVLSSVFFGCGRAYKGSGWFAFRECFDLHFCKELVCAAVARLSRQTDARLAENQSHFGPRSVIQTKPAGRVYEPSQIVHGSA
jgi:hypothetical protein